jgi:CHAT domain-containing protein/tetratricopeptide (TPR) repeat protein
MLSHSHKVLTSTSAVTKSTSCVRAVLCLLLFVSLQSVFVSTQSSAVAADSDFRSGGSIVNQLAPAAEKQFPVFLNRGESLRVSVEKGDLRIAVSLVDPGGQQLIEYPSHTFEPVEICAVAEATGLFVVKVRSLEIGSRTDQIALLVQPVHTATADDLKDSNSTLALAAANTVSTEWTEAGLRRAIEKYAEAALLASNQQLIITALKKIGETHFLLGEYRQALQDFERAATQSEKATEPQHEFEALTHVARLHSLLGNNEQAQSRLDTLWISYADINPQNGDLALKHRYAQLMSGLGEVSYSRGDLIRSIDYFERAFNLFGETRDRNEQARCLLFRGYLGNASGAVDQAMNYFQQALGLYRETGDKSGEALAITAQGITSSLDMKDEQGLKLHVEALAILTTIGDLQSQTVILNGMGQAYQHLNQTNLALEHYMKAVNLSKQTGVIDALPSSLYQVASVYREKNDLDTALAYYEECAQLSRANNKSRMEAYALNEIGTIYVTQGNREQALHQYQKIFRFYTSIRDRRGQALALNNIGDLYLSDGRKDEALAFYRRALPLSEQSGERGIEFTTRYNLARAARDSGALDEARSHIEHAVDMIEALRTNVASLDYRSSYFSGLRKHYDLYIDILMRLDQQRPGQKFAEQALLVSERARARALLDHLAEAGADIGKDVDPALLKRERELEGLLRAQARYQIEISAAENGKEQKSDLEQVERLKAEYESLQAQVRNQSHRYEALSRPNPLSLEQIQAQLRPNDLLLEYTLGEERSYLWAVTSNSLHAYELKPRSILEDATLDLYKLITARQVTGESVDDQYQARVEAADRQYYDKANALSILLLEPVAGMLEKKRLLIVTEGMLQWLPFAALPPPERESSQQGKAHDFLIADHEFVSLPSISTLAAIRAERKPTSPRRGIVVFADPVFSTNDTRLHNSNVQTPFAQSLENTKQPVFRGFEQATRGGRLRRLTHASDEADLIVAASNAAWVVKGFEASRENVMSDQISDYRILHFATHGIVNTEHPELSGIVLTMIKPDGSPTDGFLQLHDVFNLKLAADLTVLSACDTGLGKDVRGEGIIGLTRGLMFAGSRSVLASLWEVDDQATAVLMGHFYKAMLQDGLPPAAALRFAKEELRKNPAWSPPYFWAGFVLQGEYDQPIRVAQMRWPSPVLVLSLVLGIVLASWLILKKRSRATAK